MGSITTINLPKEPQMWFIASDWHSHHLHINSFNIMLKHSLLLPKNQRNLIIGGDFFDFAEFMTKSAGFQQWKDRKDGVDEYFLPAYEKEVKWGNDTLDALQSVFNHIIFMHGNHDGPRVEQYVHKYCPEGYKPNFDLNKSLNLQGRNIGSVEYNGWLDFGHISITHGMYHGPSAHKKHFQACGGRNVLFGHIHTAKCETFASRGISRSAWSLPAMCGLNPEYMRNSESAWQNGYATLAMRPDGNFNLNTHLVINDKLILPTMEILQ
jgi:predicted phosphodiesterase